MIGRGREWEEKWRRKQERVLSIVILYRWLTDKNFYASIMCVHCSCCCLFTGDNWWVRSITQPHVHKINPNAIFPSILLLSFKVAVVVVYSLNFWFFFGISTFSVHRSLILYILKFVFYSLYSPSTKQTIACKNTHKTIDGQELMNKSRQPNKTTNYQQTKSIRKMMLSWR